MGQRYCRNPPGPTLFNTTSTTGTSGSGGMPAARSCNHSTIPVEVFAVAALDLDAVFERGEPVALMEGDGAENDQGAEHEGQDEGEHGAPIRRWRLAGA